MDETVKLTHTPDCQQQAIALLSKIAANLPGMIFQFLQRQDGSQFLLYVSSGCRELYELEPEVIQADFQVLHQLIHPQDADAWTASIAMAAANLTPWRWEGRIITPSGKLKWIQGASQPEQQANGDLLWEGLVMDITERKQVEAQLRLSAQRDRLLTETLARIRSSLNLDQILQTTVSEVRQFLQADRVFIGLNDAQVGGKAVAESLDPQYPSILGWTTNDQAYIQELKNLFTSNRVRLVQDVNQVVVSPKLRAHYQQFHTQATLAVPIMLGDELLGALVANQCSGPRYWQAIEVDLLQQMSEQLAIAIEHSFIHQELAQLNANLEQQVEERTAQLQQKMQELGELQRVKDVVLHTVAHDLRTAVMGNLMVLKNLLPDAEIHRDSPSTPASLSPISVSPAIIERMIQGNDRQLGMIDSLIEMHCCEGKGIVLRTELVSLSTFLERTSQSLKPILYQNQATLKNLIAPNLPLVMADTGLLHKALVNLFTYRLQQNPPGLNFTLKAVVRNEMIRIQIQDDGAAISKLECDRLFDLYIPDPQGPCLTGVALKMYLGRQIIQAHGGEIGVISHRKRGLTFWLTLPPANPSQL
ncbi:MAG: GAF domain-containing protein [Goleter apudmare HA4340-LM2]|nr:GAF domain-containing protein [Goleter apudmare HA4340-LM2]